MHNALAWFVIAGTFLWTVPFIVAGIIMTRRRFDKDAFDYSKVCINCEAKAPKSLRYCKKCGGTLRWVHTV